MDFNLSTSFQLLLVLGYCDPEAISRLCGEEQPDHLVMSAVDSE